MPFVPEEMTGQRLDKALGVVFPAFSRSALQKAVREGRVTVESTVVCSPACLVKAGQALHLIVAEPGPGQLEPENIPLDIVFEDDHVMVINKPPGLVVHPGAGNWRGTLVHALLHHCGTRLSRTHGADRPGIVHRLDKGTSGLMVVALTDQAHGLLAEQFAVHSVTRQYVAFCQGCLNPPQGTLETLLARHPVHRQKQAVHTVSGKKAVTRWRMVAHRSPFSMVECTLHTGRTHQVRVHMAFKGHALLGDSLYGSGTRFRSETVDAEVLACLQDLVERERPALHSAVLAFTHPATGENLCFRAPLPQDLAPLERWVCKGPSGHVRA